MDIFEEMRQALKLADYKENSKGEDCGPDEDHDGQISPEELHSHFDHDSDGKVTMQDYARHIALHQAHPEWLSDEMAKLVSEYEGVPVQTHGYNSGHEDKMAEDGTATKRNPELWARAKAEAKRKMGGKHSARAMQLAVQIYKKKGGKYSGPKPAADENKMRKWTKQDWQTRPGTDEKAERSDGRTARYLPKSKWESLSKAEQKATDRKKLEGKGQYVENTEKAKVKEALEKIASRLKNPKGGLTAAGREHYKRTEGANLKPGVKNVGKKGDAEKKRWARWAMRFYTNPRGPMKNEKGEPTRLALMANAWGTKVPGTRAEAQAIAARARKMMEGIKAREKKSSAEGYEVPLPMAAREFFDQALPSFPSGHPMRDQMVEFANSVTAAADAAHAKQAYDLGATLKSTLVPGAMGALFGTMSPKGLRMHNALVGGIVSAVPSALFDIYGQLSAPAEQAMLHEAYR